MGARSRLHKRINRGSLRHVLFAERSKPQTVSIAAREWPADPSLLPVAYAIRSEAKGCIIGRNFRGGTPSRRGSLATDSRRDRIPGSNKPRFVSRVALLYAQHLVARFRFHEHGPWTRSAGSVN